MYVRCNCENLDCGLLHVIGACQNHATIRTDYGPICRQCGIYMPKEYKRMGTIADYRETGPRTEHDSTEDGQEY